MATAPIPTSGRLNTPPAVQSAVIGLRATGKSKRSIAKELGIARETVDNVLAVMQVAERGSAEIVQTQLVPKALARIGQVIDSDTDVARYVLDNTVFRQSEGDRYLVQGNMEQHLTLLPSTPGTPTTASSTSTAQLPQATEAAAKSPLSDISVSSHTNFSQFSTAELEQELARRKAATAIDAEVVG